MTRTIGVVDTTVRDGNQSLWSATALNTAMMASIAPVMDRVGYHAIDFTSSTHMAVALRWHKDDPWQRIRTMRELMPNTPLGFITPGRRFMTWEQAPEDVMRLVFECIARAGIRRVWAIDPLNNMDAAVKVAGWCKDAGIDEVVVGIVYAVSPVHTDEYFAACAREVAASPHVDVLNLKDPGGLLTPDRIRALLPILREAAAGPGIPVEVHSHCTAAVAPLVYLDAAELGADFICTAAQPLSNGTSQPSVEQTIANLRTRGFETGLDEEAIARVSSHFREIAARLGLPVGRPVEHDASLYVHQLPGGMTTTLQRHLEEAGFDGRWEDLLEEVARVRAELGYPHMVTPVSQFICVQAAWNVTGKRWDQLQGELVKYALGQYGRPPGEMDPDVKAKLLASPRAEEFANAANKFDLAEARNRWPGVDDEELLLRMMLPEGQVEAMIANRDKAPAKDWAAIQHPLKTLVAELGRRPGVRSATVESDGARVHVAREGA